MGQRSEDRIFDSSIYAEAQRQPSVSVPLVRATPEALSGFGKLVPDFDSEHVTRVTWPKAGWRQIAPGTGNHQVGVTSSVTVSCRRWTRAMRRLIFIAQ